MDTTARRRATIADVAAAAGVTTTTVSRYMNKNSYVSEATSRKIAKAMEDLHYTPSRVARSLVMQRTGVIVYVIRGTLALITQDPGLSMHYAATAAALAKHDYQILCMVVNDEAASQRLQHLIQGRFADGYVYFPGNDGDPLLRAFADGPSPTVTAGKWAVESSNIYAVVNDNRAAMRDITQYMLQQGRTHLAYVTGPESIRFARRRIHGFRDAMAHADGAEEVLVAHGPSWSIDACDEAWKQLLPALPHLDGIVAANDQLAAGIIPRLLAQGIRVPDDIAVTGFDNAEVSRTCTPQITTVDQDLERHGTCMAETLVAALNGDKQPAEVTTVPTKLVIRASA